MKTQRVWLFLTVLFLAAFTATASAQQVKTDYDRGANFAQYKT